MEEIGYFGIFLYSLGGGFIGLATGAVFAALGKLDPILVFSLAAVANYLGDCLLFFGIRWSREPFQPLMNGHRRAWAYARLVGRRHGDLVLFIQKFLHVVRTVVPLALGLGGYPARRFLFLNIPATLIWASAIFAGFYALGEAGEKIVEWFEEWGWVVPLLILIILSSVYFLLQKKGVFDKKRRKSFRG